MYLCTFINLHYIRNYVTLEDVFTPFTPPLHTHTHTHTQVTSGYSVECVPCSPVKELVMAGTLTVHEAVVDQRCLP